MILLILVVSLIVTFCAIQLAPFYPTLGDVLGVIGATVLLVVLLSFGFDFIIH